MDAQGDGPVATAFRTKEPHFIKDISSSNMRRKKLAAKYGILQAAFVPFESGVLEFGTSDGPCTADWVKMPEVSKVVSSLQASMKSTCEHTGAGYAIYWLNVR